MRIALLGYGKMGKTIEKIALSRGHQISFKINIENLKEVQEIDSSNTDVLIEFSQPASVLENIDLSIQKNIPIIVGTTGWNDHLSNVTKKVKETNGALLHASNFSLGVNILFHLNKQLASLMNRFDQYDVQMMEAHHLQKLDSPSGTAITLAEGLLENIDRKSTWIETVHPTPSEIEINALRQPDVPGTHLINYSSEVDSLEIKHVAKNRNGFALGAVIAAEWILGKKGVFGMNDVLGL